MVTVAQTDRYSISINLDADELDLIAACYDPDAVLEPLATEAPEHRFRHMAAEAFGALFVSWARSLRLSLLLSLTQPPEVV
jgi:hypothetical protein